MLVVYTFCVSHSDHTIQGILCLPYITYRDNMTLWWPLRFNSQVITVLLTTAQQSNKTSSNEIPTSFFTFVSSLHIMHISRKWLVTRRKTSFIWCYYTLNQNWWVTHWLQHSGTLSSKRITIWHVHNNNRVNGSPTILEQFVSIHLNVYGQDKCLVSGKRKHSADFSCK